MPIARVNNASSVKPGDFSNWRHANRMSVIIGGSFYSSSFIRATLPLGLASTRPRAPKRLRREGGRDARSRIPDNTFTTMWSGGREWDEWAQECDLRSNRPDHRREQVAPHESHGIAERTSKAGE